MTIDDILENFSLLDDWDDRYRYIIELGRALEPLPEELRTERTKVPGCASQVWLVTRGVFRDGEPHLLVRGDSDAHIVRGLVAILLAFCEGKSARELIDADPTDLFVELGLKEHLTPQRANGFRAMVGRLRAEAREAMGLTAALS